VQTIIAEQTEAADSPISFVGYKVRHPLQRIMTLRIGIREGVAAAPDAIAMQAIGAAAAKAVAIFEELERSWIALTGLRSSSSSSSSSGSSSGSSGSSSGSGSTASTT
jgi:DNA-directed RNA polymerase subunit L